MEGFSRLLSVVSMVASVSFLVVSAPARFLEGASSKEGFLGVKLEPSTDTEPALEMSLPGALGVLEEVLLLVLVASGCGVVDLEEVNDLVFLADWSSTTSFFLTASEPAKETVGVLETKEEGFLAEEMLPCSLDSSWRKLSGLGRNVYTHLRPNLIVD